MGNSNPLEKNTLHYTITKLALITLRQGWKMKTYCGSLDYNSKVRP